METIRYQTKAVGPNSIDKLDHCKTFEQKKNVKTNIKTSTYVNYLKGKVMPVLN
jgi:hypothetical protein